MTPTAPFQRTHNGPATFNLSTVFLKGLPRPDSKPTPTLPALTGLAGAQCVRLTLGLELAQVPASENDDLTGPWQRLRRIWQPMVRC